MITALVGAQFGSEGKGLIAGHLAMRYRVHVRVGAANAGHTLWVKGEKHVVQQLPCAAYGNPYAQLVIGAGAMISPEILVTELEVNAAWRANHDLPPVHLFIDQRAHCVTEEHKQQEQKSGLAERIGSTSTIAREGIGAAQAARVMRTGYALAIDNVPKLIHPERRVTWCDTVKLLHDAHAFGTDILLEGTQGTGLSNTTGFYPYVTSREATASGLAAQTGLGPRDIDWVILVARTYPIRVAGPSGPFFADSRELSWSDIGVDEQTERTTVTKKVRRVATFSHAQIIEAVRLNSANAIALTFADYLAPEVAGSFGPMPVNGLDNYDRLGPLIRQIEQETCVPVTWVGTGPQTVIERSPGV